MKIITAAVQKGGATKTSTIATLAQAAVYKGLRVLAIDADSQGNLSYALDAINESCDTLALLEGVPAHELIQTTSQDIDVIASNWNLATITSRRGSARRLQKALEAIRGEYDLVVIDTPTTPGELVYNALQAADGVIIPCCTDAYNMQSIYQTAMLIDQFKQSNPALEVTGLLLTRYSTRTNFAKDVREMIKKQAEALRVPYLGEVREGSAVQKAAFLRKSLYKYDKRSNPAKDYLQVLAQITEV